LSVLATAIELAEAMSDDQLRAEWSAGILARKACAAGSAFVRASRSCGQGWPRSI